MGSAFSSITAYKILSVRGNSTDFGNECRVNRGRRKADRINGNYKVVEVYVKKLFFREG